MTRQRLSPAPAFCTRCFRDLADPKQVVCDPCWAKVSRQRRDHEATALWLRTRGPFQPEVAWGARDIAIHRKPKGEIDV